MLLCHNKTMRATQELAAHDGYISSCRFIGPGACNSPYLELLL